VTFALRDATFSRSAVQCTLYNVYPTSEIQPLLRTTLRTISTECVKVLTWSHFFLYLNLSVQCRQVCQFCRLEGCSLCERGRRSNSSAWPLGILHRPSSGLKRSNTTFGLSNPECVCTHVVYRTPSISEISLFSYIELNIFSRWKGSSKRISKLDLRRLFFL
jgi:hypothetical protein